MISFIKNPLFICLTFSASLTGNAQSFSWATNAGGLLDDEAKSICTDASGNVFVTGNFESKSISFGDYTLNNSDTSLNHGDMFLVKYNSKGDVLWAVSSQGDADVRPHAICTDTKGYCYIGGYFEGTTATFGTSILKNTAHKKGDYNVEMFVVKYDANGKVKMAISGNGEHTDMVNGICTDPNGSIYITGTCYTPLILNNYTLKSPYGGIFTAKLDSIGNVIWAKATGGPDENHGNAICADAEGNCIVTGTFFSQNISFGTFKLKNYTTNTGDFFITKYDPTGKVLWAYSAGGLNTDEGNSICMDKEGNSYVTGNFLTLKFNFGKDTMKRNGYHDDGFIVKFNPMGKPEWAKTIHGDGDETGTGICIDANGNSYITGNTESTVLNADTVQIKQGFGIKDIFIASFDPSGKIRWIKTTKSESDAKSMGICLNPEGEILVTGYFEGKKMDLGASQILNSNTDAKDYSPDVFVVKLKK